MNKYIKWSIGFATIVCSLFLFAFLLFYFPPFQRWAVKKAASAASEQTGMQITLDHVRLRFPLDLSLNGLLALKPNDSLPTRRDTIARVRQAIVNVSLLPLLHSRLEINDIQLRDMKFNTDRFVPSARVKGVVGALLLENAARVDWRNQIAFVSGVRLDDAHIDVALPDTVPPDTSKSKNYWIISAGRLAIRRSSVTFHTAADSMRVLTRMEQFTTDTLKADLGKNSYYLGRLRWDGGKLHMDKRYVTRQKGLDPAHLAADRVTAHLDAVQYAQNTLKATIRKVAFTEQSGLKVTDLRSRLFMDSTRVKVQQLYLATPTSHVRADVNLQLSVMDKRNPGVVHVKSQGQLSKTDLTLLAAAMPHRMKQQWPREALVYDVELQGNMKRADIRSMKVHLPTAFKLYTYGKLANLDDLPHLHAQLAVRMNTWNLDFITAQMPLSVRRQIRVPRGIALHARAEINGKTADVILRAQQGGGTLSGRAKVNADKPTYDAHFTLQNFPLQHFVPGMGLTPFSGNVAVRGSGTDVLSSRTRILAHAKLRQFNYTGYNLSGIDATLRVANGHTRAAVNSENNLLKGKIVFDALTSTRRVNGTLWADLVRVDLYRLGLSGTPMSVGGCLHVDIGSDLRDSHHVSGRINDLTVMDYNRLWHPSDVVLDVLSRRDTTHAMVQSGDLYLNLSCSGGYKQLSKRGKMLLTELQKQMDEKYIDQHRLRVRLPRLNLSFRSGKDNILWQMLQRHGLQVKTVAMQLSTDVVKGINGYISMDSVVKDSIRIDTVRIKLTSDSVTTRYMAQVRNGKGNPTYVFNALFDGMIEPRGTSLKTRIYDAADRLGLQLALRAQMEKQGVSLHISDKHPIIGFKEFVVNDSNYVYLREDKRVSADVDLRAPDGVGLQLFTNDADTTVLQDLTLSIHRFNVGKLLSVLPYTPDVDGIISGDFHVIKSTDNLSIASAVNVEGMKYEGWNMGDISSEFTYMPKSDGSHYISGSLSRFGREVASFDGNYVQTGEGKIDAELTLNKTPLDLVNGFIPDRIVGFRGNAEGTLSVKGALSHPNVNGSINMDSAYIYSEPYGVSMRFADEPVVIENSRLKMDNFKMYAHNDQPLTLQGYCDFSDMSKIFLDTRMRAQNFMLVDAKENNRSEAYGKAFVNYYGTMKGLLDNLQLRGRLEVLGATELKYNLKDSPLNTDNQLNELVEFVNLRDTVPDIIARPQPKGLDMDMSIGIDEGAHVDAYLNAEHSNYLRVQGGGSMRLQYNNTDHLRLTGRYTIGEGEMKYALPVIPLKTFSIEEGSYIEFRGDAMNPQLNITATETTKASVSSDGSSGRLVQFTCGVVVSQTLQNMGLEFTIDAPEDLTIHNQLQAMSKEERGKLAVTMLTTGMYLADGNTSQFTMNAALSAFLNSQINQISSSALRSMDVSFGMDNTTDATGRIHTDYSFKFAKRFWNNRLRIVIGGKLSSGADVGQEKQTFFDNVTFEYRLSDTSSKYLRLFYNRDSYDWLEGTVSKFGGGFTWKRKLLHFRDIFRFRDDDGNVPPAMSTDSTSNRVDKSN